MSIPTEAIDAAVTWWADALLNQASNDNGDGLQSMMLDLHRDLYPKLTPETVAAFAATLSGILTREGEKSDSLILSVDYGPSDWLAEACKGSAIERGDYFPCKTHMWLHPDSVTVSSGYRVPERTVWQRAPMETQPEGPRA